MAVIYKLFLKSNPHKIYIGSAIDFNLRKIRHKHQLKKRIHKNSHLQRLVNKYGLHELTFEVIETVLNDCNLIIREQHYIDLLKPEINILKIAGSALGYRHSEKTKGMISKKNKGRKMTSEQIRRGVISRIGQKTCNGIKRSDEFKKMVSDRMKVKVINIINGHIINSVTEAAELINMKYSTLYAKLSGRNLNNTTLRFL